MIPTLASLVLFISQKNYCSFKLVIYLYNTT